VVFSFSNHVHCGDLRSVRLHRLSPFATPVTVEVSHPPAKRTTASQADHRTIHTTIIASRQGVPSGSWIGVYDRRRIECTLHIT
jgi:hypothetical protein